MLVRLIYASKISEVFTPDDIASILNSARKNNKRDFVTGLLCFNRNCFMQCLEGDRAVVNRTLQRIMSDNRHKEVNILHFGEISSRAFCDWEMEFVPESTSTAPIYMKYSTSERFLPHEIGSASALELMVDLYAAMNKDK